MRRFLIIITIALASTSVYAQYPRQTRPQWNGYYNGHGFSPGYSYDTRSGCNTLKTPNGNWIHYRDGYVPLRQGYRSRYYQPYNFNSYADTIGGLIYGNGW